MVTEKPAQAVTWKVRDHRGAVVMTFETPGVTPLDISVEPQAAFEMGEALSRAAHVARFGKPVQTDIQYLHQQIRSRVTEDMRMLLVQRLSVMLNSLRHNPGGNNGRLAAELVDTILTKVA